MFSDALSVRGAEAPGVDNHGRRRIAAVEGNGMVLILSILAVALVAAVSGFFAIPIGIFLGLHPLTVYLTTVITAIAVTWILLAGGRRIRVSIANRLGHGEHTERRTRRLVERYGAVGLGFFGPVFPGVVASSISGVAVGIEPTHLGRWLNIGIAVWFGVFTLIWWAVRNAFVS